MSPTYSATVIRKPRKRWSCALCQKPIAGPYLRLFGCAEPGDKPYRMAICLDCGAGTSDPPVRKALVDHWGLPPSPSEPTR